MSKGYRLVMNTQACLGRFQRKKSFAQKWLDNEVLKDNTPKVPMRTGYLFKSGQTGTVIGSGKVEYNAPYAKSNYYALNRNFSKDKHPQACAQWFEVTKAEKKKDWMNGVDKIMKE